MIDLFRFVGLVADCFLVLVNEAVCFPITLPMLWLLLALIRLLELAAGCFATVGGGVLCAPNVELLREFVRFVEL